MCATTRGSAALPRPGWTRLYTVGLVGMVALAVVDRSIQRPARTALEGLVGAAVIVALALWVRANRAALDQRDWCACAADTVTVRVIASRPADVDVLAETAGHSLGGRFHPGRAPRPPHVGHVGSARATTSPIDVVAAGARESD
jgi:hypothetical protein